MMPHKKINGSHTWEFYFYSGGKTIILYVVLDCSESGCVCRIVYNIETATTRK